MDLKIAKTIRSEIISVYFINKVNSWFLIKTNEANKPGKPKSIKYEMKVKKYKSSGLDKYHKNCRASNMKINKYIYISFL
jgi:hypothetical protein